jgi:hypothetical protein
MEAPRPIADKAGVELTKLYFLKQESKFLLLTMLQQSK